MNSHLKNGYNKLFEATIRAHPNKNKQMIQDDLTILWKEIKNNEKNLDDELMKLNDICKQRKGSFMKFWGKVPKKSEGTPTVFQTPLKEEPTTTTQIFEEKENASSSKITAEKHTPAQTKLNLELKEIEKKIADYHIIQKVDLTQTLQRDLESLIKSKKSTELKLKTLKINQISKQKQRSHRKRQHEELKINNAPAAKKIEASR